MRSAVEQRLEVLLAGTHGAGELGAALRYSLLARGKRIRPILTILASWELGADDLSALDAGCALEMIHTASLILDDMPAMDDAQERRGQAATHVRFGEDVAMLSAIALLNHAYATVAAMRGISPAARCEMIGVLTRAVGLDGLAGGQFADLRPAANGPRDSDVARANDLKTGTLFTAAIELAALVCGSGVEQSAGLRRCAAEIGQAFQMLDDLADGVATDGRRPEDDGKATLLNLLGSGEARRRLARHVDSALAALRPEGHLAGFIRSIFEGGTMLPQLVGQA